MATHLPPLFNIETLLPYIREDYLILTPNQRLLSKILQAWGEQQQSTGSKVWQAPRIEVIDQWLLKQWHTLQSQGHPNTQKIIASHDQQRIIWEQLTANCGLMQTEAIAKQAASAYKTLKQWKLSASPQYNINPQLIEWAQQFKQQLETINSITLEDCYSIIGEAFDNHLLEQEPHIALLGFDDISPLMREQLNKASRHIIELDNNQQPATSLKRLSFPTSNDEMAAAARWSRNILHDQPNARIGIIVPNLGQCREAVEFAFTAEFEAHSLVPGMERYTLPFNISTGIPLATTPLINNTLNLLKTNKKQWDISTIEGILLSSFWGCYSAELPQRCALIDRLKRLGTFTISDSTLRYEAEKIERQYRDKEVDERHASYAGVYSYFHQLHDLTTSPDSRFSLYKKQLPSAWVDVFLEQLRVFQWPGERTPDSQEYQQTQLWYQLLENFSHLDNVSGVIDHHTALTQLESMANSLPFQPKVPDSPIQILGILEGVGLNFTHCWVMGLHQRAWPPTAAPNPLLPINLQREQNMPHASSLRELAYAQSLTKNYRHCADHIIMSAPNSLDDSAQALLPSQLIADIPLGSLDIPVGEDSLTAWDQQLQAQRQHNNPLTIIPCADSAPYSDTLIVGGTGVLAAQAANPFDSFSKYRLQANNVDMPVSGFSSAEKGNILHNALATIWHQLKDHQGLVSQTDEALAALIHNSVSVAINDIRKYKPSHLSPALCEIECERQSEFIKEWLDFEKTRAPFSVIAIEEAQTIEFEGRQFNIRIDRVDQLQDGSLLIIDYKTGSPSIGAWKGERLQEPQLPLYALSYANHNGQTAPVKGISFAQINAKQRQFVGAAETPIAEGIPTLEKNRSGLPQNWKDARAQWQQAISQLVQSYCQGDCRVDYKDNASLSSVRDYNKEQLRLNRFYEARDIMRLIASSEEHH